MCVLSQTENLFKQIWIEMRRLLSIECTHTRSLSHIGYLFAMQFEGNFQSKQQTDKQKTIKLKHSHSLMTKYMERDMLHGDGIM